MSEKNSYIKIPPGSKIEIKEGDEREAKDLASSTSSTHYHNKESQNIHNKSNSSNFETSSSGSTSKTSSEANLDASSSKLTNTELKDQGIVESKQEFDKECSDQVKEIAVDEAKKINTLRVKIKNIFKFK